MGEGPVGQSFAKDSVDQGGENEIIKASVGVASGQVPRRSQTIQRNVATRRST